MFMPLEGTRAEDFMYLNKLETQNPKDRLVLRKMQDLQVKVQRMERRVNELQQTVMDLQDYVDAERSNAEQEKEELMAKWEFQAGEIRTLEETVEELRTKLAKIEGNPHVPLSLPDEKSACAPPNLANEEEKLALPFVVENLTEKALKIEENFSFDGGLFGRPREYEKMAEEIPAEETKSFGFAKNDNFAGFFSYWIADVLLLVRYDVTDNDKSIALAFCPRCESAGIGRGVDLFNKLSHAGWSAVPDGAYSTSGILRHDDPETGMIVTGNFGKIEASASLKTGKRESVTVRIFDF